MSKHTAGPWWIEKTDAVDLPNHVGISSDKHGLLAQVVWCMEEDERTPVCEANANLIAAAPELLEALEKIIDSGEIPYCESDPLVIKAKEVITKAKGVSDEKP